MLKDGNCTLERCDADEILSLRFMGICSAASCQEMQFLLEDYLSGLGLVRLGIANGQVITSSGWELLDELNRGQIESNTGFIAMSFKDELRVVFEKGLYPGIRTAGYEPIRVDRLEHNNKIDDEIIAAIRRCKFLVADFSVLRGGIYFEAGFAMGLGRPVIWTVENSRLEDVHFDNRQYNFIRWSDDDLNQFAIALRNRIEATIGPGTLPQVV